MFILAAIASSMLFGFADFAGGVATRRAAAISVVAASQVAGAALIFVLVATIGRGEPTASAFAWGTAGGVVGSLGLVILYHALATTRMTVAAPSAAVAGAVVPVIVGVALGERPDLVAWWGVALAVPAVALVTVGHGAGEARPGATRAFLAGGAAGTLFGLFGVFLSRTASTSGMWPLVAARLASIVAVALVALVWRRPLLPPTRVLPVAVAAGVLDMGANAAFVVGLRAGYLSLVAVIASLYPAVTIALARFVLRERIGRLQAVGLVLAAGAVALIAGG